MKKLLTIIIVSSLASCSIKVVPLKGAYPETPIVYTSNRPVSEVWDRLVDFFAQTGYSIKIIDKSSGLIVANRTLLPATYEDAKGRIIYDTAYVVLTHYKGQEEYTRGLKYPGKVTGDWNVRIKADGDKTSININLVNILQQTSAIYYSDSHRPLWEPVNGVTTGRFEKTLYEIIK